MKQQQHEHEKQHEQEAAAKLRHMRMRAALCILHLNVLSLGHKRQSAARRSAGLRLGSSHPAEVSFGRMPAATCLLACKAHIRVATDALLLLLLPLLRAPH
eukprot:354887-Chlamydomonas_euryale.AAC.9